VASAQDIVESAYKLLGAPYRTWELGDPLPMWKADGRGDPPPASHLKNVGVMCADLINFALEDNGLRPGGGTQAFGDYLVNTSGFDPDSPGEPGAIAYRPYRGPELGAQGHIALYVDEHTLIQALGGRQPRFFGVTDQFTDKETYSWGGNTLFTVYGFLPRVDYSGPSRNGATHASETYPGDTATPKEVAHWMAHVAHKKYDLPGILPVMTSCVELTDAWTGPGDVKDVTGYLRNVDACSVGYFQQQADDLGCGRFGWGTRAQLIKAEYALRRFCEEAVKYKGRFNAGNIRQLGEWCATVQRPREDLRHLYADKGYPMASKLLRDWKPGKNTDAKIRAPKWIAINSKGLLVANGSDCSRGWYDVGYRRNDWSWHGPEGPEPEGRKFLEETEKMAESTSARSPRRAHVPSQEEEQEDRREGEEEYRRRRRREEREERKAERDQFPSEKETRRRREDEGRKYGGDDEPDGPESIEGFTGEELEEIGREIVRIFSRIRQSRTPRRKSEVHRETEED
jgi:hypothetical protein